MNIPAHLEHLRTDRRGLPVPYINRWGPERPETLSIAVDHHVGDLAVFQDDSGETVPDFTAQNMQRQRETMYRGLCQVCARPVPWPRFLVLGDLSATTISVGGRTRTAITEPWLCAACLVFALKTCPALIRRRRDEDLIPVSVEEHQVQFVVSRGWIEGALEDESRATQPAMWVKAILRPLPPIITPAAAR